MAAGRVGLAGLAVAALVRRARAGLAASPLLSWRFSGREPPKILFAPQELRTADPTRGAEILAGRFVFAGQSVATEASPFAVEPPNAAWHESLVAFTWLRHLAATNSREAAPLARRLMVEFLRGPGRHRSGPVFVAARRVLAWLSASPLLLQGADRRFARGFRRSLAWRSRNLLSAARSEVGLSRLLGAIAATQAGLCLAGQDALRRRATSLLVDELTRQVLPDGGHVSRNPGAVIELLLDLLPLRQSFAARGLDAPAELLGAIDRLMPMLRFFRHTDGSFGAFNGMGHTQAHLVATLLAYDDAGGQPVLNASHSGYQRLEAGGCVLLLDSGAPPPANVSGHAHAGIAGLEFSVPGGRLIVGCGAPSAGQDRWRELARLTAAHSTAVVGDESSAEFAAGPVWSTLLGRLIVAGPARIRLERHSDEAGPWCVLEHDGFAAFGLVHRRALSLDLTGALIGEDAFFGPDGSPYRGRAPLILRFHCHPAVEVEHGLAVVKLVAPGGGRWTFHAGGLPLEIQDSIHFANPGGARRSLQIVVAVPPVAADAGPDDAPPAVAWSIEPSR